MTGWPRRGILYNVEAGLMRRTGISLCITVALLPPKPVDHTYYWISQTARNCLYSVVYSALLLKHRTMAEFPSIKPAFTVQVSTRPPGRIPSLHDIGQHRRSARCWYVVTSRKEMLSKARSKYIHVIGSASRSNPLQVVVSLTHIYPIIEITIN